MDNANFFPPHELDQIRGLARRAWLQPVFLLFLSWFFFTASINTAAKGSDLATFLLLLFTAVSVGLGLWTMKTALRYRELWRQLNAQQELAIKSETIYLMAEIEVYLAEN